MGVAETLKLVITGDATGAIRELNKLNAAADKTLGGAATSGDRLKKVLGNISTRDIALGFGIAGTAAVAFGAASVRAAQEDEAAHAALQKAVENTGASYDTYGETIEATEKKLIGLGFADNETADSLGRLTGATGDVGIALDQMGLAADIARGRHISLGEATGILTKVAIGNVGALRRLGIETKDATGATISQEEAIKRLTALYGGQAATFAGTYEGKIAALKETFGELQEEVGYALIPTLTKLASVTLSSVNTFSKVQESASGLHLGFGDVARTMAQLTPVIGPITESFGVLNQLLGDSSEESKNASNVTKELAATQLAYADHLAAGTQATTEGVAARKALTDAEANSKLITDGLAEATGELGEEMEDAGQSIDQYRKALKDANDQQRDFAKGILDISANADTLEADFIEFRQGLADYAEKAADGTTSTDDLRLAQLDLQGQIRDTAKDAGDAAFQQATLAGKSNAAALGADAQRDALFRLAASLDPANPLRQFIGGLISDLDNVSKIHANPTLDLTVRINGQQVPIAAVNSAIGAGGQFIRPAGRAHGGPVGKDQLYMVGENGPELFSPSTNGAIIPNGSVARGGGGNVNVNVYVSGSVISERDLVQKVNDGLIAARNRGYAA